MPKSSHCKDTVFDWFDPQDYSAQNQLDSLGWRCSLYIRHEYLRDIASRRNLQAQGMSDETLSSDALREHYWQTYRKESSVQAILAAIKNGDYERTYPLQENVRAVRNISPIIESNNVSALQFEATHTPVLYVAIYPTASNAIIHESVAQLLKQLREGFPLKSETRRPEKLNKVFTKTHFASWERYQVLACLDLDFYALVHNIPKLTFDKVCLATDPGYSGTVKERGRDIREKAIAALSSIGILDHQIINGGTK